MRCAMAAAVAVGACVLLGCSSTPATPAGFLGRTEQLRPDPQEAGRLYYEKPGVDWKRYRKVMIDPVRIHLSAEARERDLRPQDARQMAEYFRSAALEQLAGKWPVVAVPGPDVLRIRAAITDLVPTDVAVNVLSTLAAGIAVDMGGAAMEAEFLDGATGERLAAVVDRKSGSPLDLVENYTTWAQARAAFDAWAEELVEGLGKE